MMNNMFSYYVQTFFSEYLPITRNLSQKTIQGYSYGMLIFLSFLRENKIDIDAINVNEITIDLIEKFIHYLLEERKNSSSTINNRISMLKSFFNYIELKSVENFNICAKIKNLKLRKTDKKIPDRLTIEEIEIILNSIDYDTKSGLKGLAIFALLYDSAIRVQELCDLTVNDLELNKTPFTVFIANGKGSKKRIVPISESVKNIILEYLKVYNITEGYLFLNKNKKQYTRKGINYQLNKFYQLAKSDSTDATLFTYDKIHPHMLRHSKATHMIENNINLLYVRDFLGHEHFTSSEIYTKISSKKRDELILETSEILPLKKKKTFKEKENLENWLKSTTLNK